MYFKPNKFFIDKYVKSGTTTSIEELCNNIRNDTINAIAHKFKSQTKKTVIETDKFRIVITKKL